MASWKHVVLVVALGAPTAAEAQDSIEEVIVTARRRTETLQETPVSVTALTAESMQRLGVNGVADVALRAPGLQYGAFGDLKLSPTSLRGVIGSSGSAGADPAVGYYVDDVFVGQGAGANLDLYDIERVEVLRGPQGTLFGRNTIGGVISITTKRPTSDFEASALAEASNFNGLRLASSVSGPISDTISGKFALMRDRRDGTSRNVFLEKDVNDRSSWSVRGQLAFDLAADSELLLTADYRAVDQHPLMFETLKYNDAATLPNVLDLAGIPRNDDPYDRRVMGDVESEEELSAYGLAATIRTRLGGVSLTGITSYREHDYYSRTDTDRTPLSIAYDGDPEDVWRLSQELRGELSTGALDWIGGVYYLRQTSINQSFIEVGSDLAGFLGDPSLAGLLVGSDAKLTTESFSGFLSGTWNISRRLDLTAGARYTRDEKKIGYAQSDPLGLLGGDARIDAGDHWGELTPSFNLRFRATPDVMAYATAAKGFKSGGFNDALGDATDVSFGPESLWNYEAGLKAKLLEGRLIANVAAYYMDWTDIQITQDNPLTAVYDPIILNGGKAHTKGIEAEATVRPGGGWNLGFTAAVQEARYDGGALPDGRPLRNIPFAPAYTVAVSVEKRWEVEWGEVSALAEYLARGRTYLTPNNDPDGRVAPYGLLNLRFAVEPEGGRWRAAVWAKNLANESYTTRMFDAFDQDLVGQKFIALGEPRTYGVELVIRY